jgi:putative inorganic carbon (hco3(-)) transporter
MMISLAEPSAVTPARTPGLNLYLLFVISWFLHLPARLEVLGAIRFDLLLVCILTAFALTRGKLTSSTTSEADRALRVLVLYSVLTIPFVYWPGSVIKSGLPNFLKAVVFFYFTIAFVRTEPDLRRFVFVFVTVQMVRVLEPLYLHFVYGYWGSQASMANWESMSRLSGAPSDVINPNGLAFVICTVLPFLFFMASLSSRLRLAALLLLPAVLYALALTGSRSGLIGLIVVILGIAIKSKNFASLFLVTVIGLVIGGLGFAFLSADLQDRYLSILGKGEKNAETADDRIEGMRVQLDVLMHRPIVGHGLGASPEANANFTVSGPYALLAMPAHNLFLEIGQEIGLMGVIIFLFFAKAIISGFAQSRRALMHHDPSGFLQRVVDAMQVWLAMNVVFSFASYGLSSYEWYLFGGLSVVVQRLAQLRAADEPKRTGESVKEPAEATTRSPG